MIGEGWLAGWLAELLPKRVLAVEATEMGAELHVQGDGRRRAWFVPSTDTDATHKPLAWVCREIEKISRHASYPPLPPPPPPPPPGRTPFTGKKNCREAYDGYARDDDDNKG